MDQPSSEAADEYEHADDQPPQRTWRFFSIRTLLLGCALIWGITRLPHEIGYWQLASAQNAAAAGDLHLADLRVAQAAKWLTGSALPFKVQSQFKFAANHVEDALDSISQALERSPHDNELKLNRCWLWLAAQKTAEMQREIERLSKLDTEELPYRLELARMFSVRGDHETALNIINQITYSKQEAEFVCHYKSDILKQTGRYSAALEACQVAVEMTSDPLLLAEERTHFLLHTEQTAAALKLAHQIEKEQCNTLWKQLLDYLWPSMKDRNGSAYFRAVANQELDVAEKQASAAVRISSGEIYAFLDTRGFVYYRQGKFEEGLADMNRAIARMELELAVPELSKSGDQSRAALISFSPYQAALYRRHTHEMRAVLYYHRALLLQALKQHDQAERDMQRVKTLGFEPNEHLF